ncbi:TM0106 family RecB-like putative nuclease [Phenylobacterium sp.]|uniref:TM0106 family RecB-like putative nuclease n=1 Tax=Phenylobacterium sp. TaxID=1871053 RepID=UPI002732DD31|nr:TM0106 family RecB-like putative nuclease [Phenylobacterium sp.]MDP3659217.1 TM0106 family RecB-like putative nuclease [Phenylobacterium sp.]
MSLEPEATATRAGASSQPVTGSMLYDLIQCPHRVYADTFSVASERDEVSPFVRMLWERGSNFEAQVMGSRVAGYVDLTSVSRHERERLTREAMDRGEPLIYRGQISADDLLGMPDVLRKEVGGYVPGDIKSGAGEFGGDDEHEPKPKLHYAVQLALYVDILQRLSLAAGRRGFIWDVRGEEVSYDFDKPISERKPRTLWDEYLTAREGARSILSTVTVTRPAYSSTCKLCHWHTRCLSDLEAMDDLSLIPHLGRAKRDAMLDYIPTLAEFASMELHSFITKGRTPFARVGEKSLRTFHTRARLLKSPSPAPFLKESISLPLVSRELFFDIEVDPMREICYLHGIVERLEGDNATERFIGFFTEDESEQEEERAFAEAWAYLTADPNALVYYFSKYERTIYRKLQAKYPSVCTREDVEALFHPEKAIDLYFDVVFPATEWPTRDYSLKTLARYLGFNWRDENPSGAASIEWFDRWVKGRDPADRQRILEYNEDDCRATRVVLDGIRALAA